VNPLLLWMLEPTLPPIPEQQIHVGLSSLESWLIRRAIVGVTTKNYNRSMLELLRRLREEPRETAGDLIRDFLVSQRPITSYWPGDDQVREALTETPIYRRVPKQRLRMVLEAVEDRRRHIGGNSPFQAEQPMSRANTTLEHVMPQSWEENWPLGDRDRNARDLALQTIGNLTLLTSRMNSAVSNKGWAEKRDAVKEHSTLLLSDRDITNVTQWDEDAIASRGKTITDEIVAIWPIPANAVGTPAIIEASYNVTIATLLQAGALTAGQVLRGRNPHPYYATVLPDGRLDVAGVAYKTPSGAAKAAQGRGANGWWWWLVDYEDKVSLNDVWNEFQANDNDGLVQENDED